MSVPSQKRTLKACANVRTRSVLWYGKIPWEAARSVLESPQDLSNQIWGTEKGAIRYRLRKPWLDRAVTLLDRDPVNQLAGVEIIGIPFHVAHEGPGRVHFDLVVETYDAGQLVRLDPLVAEAALAETHEDGDEGMFFEVIFGLTSPTRSCFHVRIRDRLSIANFG